MRITRRHALKLAMGGLGLSTALASGFPASMTISPAWAQQGFGIAGKTVIKIFMRGGADGLYLFPPFGDQNYRNLRPTVAIDSPSDSDPDSALNLNGFIGFNPNLLPWMEIWDNGDFALFPAAHFDGASRSHFENQRWIEQGILSTSGSGYLNRYMGTSDNDSPFRALGAGGSGVPAVLQGAITVPGIRDIDDFQLRHGQWCDGDDCAENRLLSTLKDVYAADQMTGLPVEGLTLAQGTKLVRVMEQIRELDGDYETNAGGLEYSNSSLGRGLRLLAQGIKADLGIETAAVDWGGGWDSHSNQRPGNISPTALFHPFNGNMRRGADDILTFYRDLGERRKDVIMIIGTEFGRTSRQNGSAGTDHGNAGGWMVIGGPAKSGVYGDWPGLASNQLYQGRYLAQSVNYKDIVAEALIRHLGMDQGLVSTVFPDHSFTDHGAISA